MAEVQSAMDIVMAADIEALLKEAKSIEEGDQLPEEEELAPESSADVEAAADDVEAAIGEEAVAVEAEEEVLLDAFGQPIVQEELVAAGAGQVLVEDGPAGAMPIPDQAREAPADGEAPARTGEFVEEEDESGFELDRSKGKEQRRQDRQRRRQLVLDEKSGEVIAKRRRKGRRGSWDEETWEDYDY